jgi:AcrR family transcriptional regulator
MNQLLNAALEMGLEDLTIAGLAAKLGTGMAAVYRLVESRDDLVLRAAAHATEAIPPAADVGQSWGGYMLEYAERVFGVLSRDGHYLARFIEGGLGPEVQIDHVEAALQALVKRGFAREDALKVIRAVTHVVLGGAAASVHIAAAGGSGVGHGEAARRALAKRPAEQIPVLSSIVGAYADEAMMTDWRASLRWLLAGLASERGERLPEGL